MIKVEYFGRISHRQNTIINNEPDGAYSKPFEYGFGKARQLFEQLARSRDGKSTMPIIWLLCSFVYGLKSAKTC